MDRRFIIVLTLLCLLGADAAADAVIYRKGNRLEVVGMKDKVEVDGEDVAITPDNIEIYAPQESEGVIVVDSYDVVEIKRNDRAKSGQEIPREDVVRVVYTTEPAALIEAYNQMQLGAWAQAIGAFRDVINNPDAREVYKNEANFQIGVAFLQSGRAKDALSHFKGWSATKSKHTPNVFRIVAELLTQQKKYDEARSYYAKIGDLANVPELWKHKARLGDVKVSIAERKYVEAEQAAASIARQLAGKPALEDARALALALQADAIRQAGDANRLSEAQRIIDEAAKLEGENVSHGTRAFVQLTRGHIIYAQRNPAEARFPYMRVALMYPDTGFEGDGFNNAGLCFVDLAGRFENEGDQAKSDEHLVKGMKLLGTAAGRYRNAEARKHYLANRDRYEKAKARLGATDDEDEDEEGK